MGRPLRVVSLSLLRVVVPGQRVPLPLLVLVVQVVWVLAPPPLQGSRQAWPHESPPPLPPPCCNNPALGSPSRVLLPVVLGHASLLPLGQSLSQA